MRDYYKLGDTQVNTLIHKIRNYPALDNVSIKQHSIHVDVDSARIGTAPVRTYSP